MPTRVSRLEERIDSFEMESPIDDDDIFRCIIQSLYDMKIPLVDDTISEEWIYRIEERIALGCDTE